MKWEMVKLGDIATSIQPGPFGSQLHNSDYSEFGTPLIMPKDMINGHISHENLIFVGNEHVSRLSRHQVHEGNIMVARKGDVRKCVYITENEDGWMTGSDCLKVALNDAVCFPKFIYYQLRSPYIGKWLETISIGATMPSLNTGLLSGIELVLPPIPIQKRITDILSAYDDLIENNQKQIKLLEEAAQRLYKEWFIDLRFPGHENTPIHNGLPDRWNRVSVADCLAMHINGGWGTETEDTKHCFSGKVIRGTDINDIKSGNYSDIPLRYHTKNDIISRSLIENDIVFELSNGNINNIGRTLLIDQYILKQCGNNTICASFCKLFRPIDKMHALILLFEIQEMQLNGKMLVYKKHGSNGINNFAFEDFLKHELLIPDVLQISPFELSMQKIGICQQQISQLKESSKRLLPKLMNGEMR